MPALDKSRSRSEAWRASARGDLSRACPRAAQPSDAIPAESGVFFTTYTMLSADFGGEPPRFKQLTDWLRPDFDGVIAFHEAHLMKNAAATKRGGGEVGGLSSMPPAATLSP